MNKAMKNEKQALVPRLRFPKFREAGEWEAVPLDRLGHFFRGLTYGADDVADGGLLVVRSSNIQGGRLILDSDLVFVAKSCPSELRLKRGDIVICMSNGSKALVGKSGELDRDYPGELTVGAFCSIFRPLTPFAKIAFNTPRYTKFVANGIAGGNINNLKNSDLERFEFHVPPSPPEQQKIADCLSSLDALIVALTDKIDALKAHKKGLMQQLFPREGETVPHLRFPEFRDAGEWRKCKLEEFAKRGSGHTPNKKYPNYYNGGIKWVSLADSDKLDNGYIFKTKHELSKEGLKNSSAVLHPAETVVLSRDAGVGKSAVLHSPMAVSQHFIAWRCDNSMLNNWFFYYLLQRLKPELESIAMGNTIKTIGLSYFKSMAIMTPSLSEQEKVASCLSSLDTVIAAHSKKLDALKTHKKSLMQQLFPSPEAVGV